jgi:hypothetical protein
LAATCCIDFWVETVAEQEALAVTPLFVIRLAAQKSLLAILVEKVLPVALNKFHADRAVAQVLLAVQRSLPAVLAMQPQAAALK